MLLTSIFIYPIRFDISQGKAQANPAHCHTFGHLAVPAVATLLTMVGQADDTECLWLHTMPIYHTTDQLGHIHNTQQSHCATCLRAGSECNCSHSLSCAHCR